MADDPSLYGDLLADPLYARTVVNTALFVGLGVNVEDVPGLCCSRASSCAAAGGSRPCSPSSILPWALPTIPAFVSFHWMLIGEEGLVDASLSTLLGVDGPLWFNDRWPASASNIAAYIWKWLPFWTVTFSPAGWRSRRRSDDAADIDGATGFRRFAAPRRCRCWRTSTWSARCCATVWMIGDFNTPEIVSGGAPEGSTDVLATSRGRLPVWRQGQPALGVAVGDVGAAAADPDRVASGRGGCAMARCSCDRRAAGRPARLRRAGRSTGCGASLVEVGSIGVGVVLLIWWVPADLQHDAYRHRPGRQRRSSAATSFRRRADPGAFEAVLFKGYWYLRISGASSATASSSAS